MSGSKRSGIRDRKKTAQSRQRNREDSETEKAAEQRRQQNRKGNIMKRTADQKRQLSGEGSERTDENHARKTIFRI